MIDYKGMKARNRITELLERYQNNTASEQEKKWVEEWYGSLDELNGFPVLDKQEASVLHKSTLEVLRKRAGKGRQRSLVLWSSLAAACVAVMVLALAYFLSGGSGAGVEDGLAGKVFSDDKPTLFYTSSAEERSFLLPDNTRINLRRGSTLTLDEDFNSASRKVVLEGEAFFDVSHNPSKPFYVITGEVVTKVLGTSFLVSAFKEADSITVAVTTGKVFVFEGEVTKEEKSKRNYTIKPNQKVVYSKVLKIAEKKLVEEPRELIPEQEKQKMKYVAAPLKEVIGSLEKLYGVEITYDSLTFAECRLTTTIQEDGIHSRLKSICRAIKASYRQEDGKLILEGEGCR